jgi:hypothetical protein
MDLARVWEEILFLIENKMTRQGYDTWFAQSKLVSFDGSRIRANFTVIGSGSITERF